MPAKNEIVPLDAGPTRQTLATAPAPVPAKPTKGKRNEAANADALSAQERRIRIVAKQRRHTAFQLFYALFGMALMVGQIEYVWFANTRGFDGTCLIDATTHCPMCLASLSKAVPVPEGRMMLHALRVLISFSTVILLYYIHAFYAAECEVLKIKNIVPPTATLLSSPLRSRLVFELLLFVIHPFPGLEAIDPRWPNLVVGSSLLMLPRLFLLFRVVQFRHSFNSSNGWFIGALTNVDFTAGFFLKSTLRYHPSRWIIACFLLLLIVTGYSLFVVERFLCTFHADSCCKPIPFTDSLWTLVITILTIGYGDIVPHTGAGRFFAVLAGLCGTVFTAVTIAVMSTYLVLTRSEHKVNAFIKKDENRKLVNDHAARAIQAFVQLRAAQSRFRGVTTSRARAAISRAENKLYAVLRVYRQVKRFVNSHDVSDPMDKQMTMLEMMEVNVEYIRTKIEDLSELFHAQVDKHNKSKRKVQTAALTTSAALTLAQVGATANALAQAARLKPVEPGSKDTNESETPVSSATGLIQLPPVTTSSGNGSPTSMPRASGVPGQPPLYDSDNDSASGHRPRIIAKPDGVSELIPAVRARPISASAKNQAPLNGQANMPEWAVVMELTMQAILQQVTAVSLEMDSLRSRMENQMDQLQSRVSDIERRLGVQDAFREIARGPSIRRALSRTPSSNGQFETSGNAGTVGEGHSNSGSGTLAAIARFSRTSFSSHRPSIHNFVTSKELDDFHASGSID